MSALWRPCGPHRDSELDLKAGHKSSFVETNVTTFSRYSNYFNQPLTTNTAPDVSDASSYFRHGIGNQIGVHSDPTMYGDANTYAEPIAPADISSDADADFDPPSKTKPLTAPKCVAPTSESFEQRNITMY